MQKTCSKCGMEYPSEATLCLADGFPLIAVKAAAVQELKIGPRYVVESEIGRGGMGAIYKARHIAMDRPVAIKLLLADISKDPEAMMRFQVEARAASILSHPNIIKIFEFDFTEQGMPYLVMEYLEGVTISETLTRYRRLPFEVAVPIFIEICGALSHAHNRNVVHRDLKPSNIMVVKDDDGRNRPMLLDFGIAKMFTTPGKTAMRLTQTGEVFGSPMYMSPEQCMGQTVDARSDVYSLGCVMYEVLTGIPPVQGQNFLALVYAHLHDKPLPFGDVASDFAVPKELEKIVLKALNKSADQRHSSMKELQSELENFFHKCQTGSSEKIETEETNRSFVDRAEVQADIQDENKKLDDLHVRADAGDVDAQYDLAHMYYEGTMLNRDLEMALYWHKKAAGQKFVESICWLGFMYKDGEGVEQDYAQALRYFQQGADLGHVLSQSCLAECYEYGRGVDVDNDLAVYWHSKAANGNHAVSMSAMGHFYEYGIGVEQNNEQAASWHLKAAEKGLRMAQHKMGCLYAEGRGVKKDLEEAASWYLCAAQQGYDDSKVSLSYCYLDGAGVPPDEQEALMWMQYAAEAGHEEAQNWIAFWYQEGMMGLEQNSKTAFRWYSKSALKKNSWAQYELGIFCENGDGVERNERQAYDWYKRAAEQGLKEAQTALGRCYRDGIGTAVDEKMFISWTEKAAEQGLVDAMYDLGLHYEEVGRDLRKAHGWYKQAADLGDKRAKTKLLQADFSKGS